MATTSTVPDVRAALVSLLTSAINDTAVQVTHGRQQNSIVKRKVVAVGAASPYSSEIANLKTGRKQRDETYSVEVLFFVGKPRGIPYDADSEVWTLFAELEDILADDPTLGGVDGLVWAVLGDVEADVAIEKEGPVAWIAASVNCKARLV